MSAHDLFTAVLVYLLIGSILWAFVLAPQGFGGAKWYGAIAASCGEIIAWPIIVFVIMKGCLLVDQVERERH